MGDKRWVTRDGRQETEDRRGETGDQSQEMRDKVRETGDNIMISDEVGEGGEISLMV